MPSAASGPSTSRSLPTRPTPVLAGCGVVFSPGSRSLSSGPLDKPYAGGLRGQRTPLGYATASAAAALQDAPGRGISRAPIRRSAPPLAVTSNGGGGPCSSGRACDPGSLSGHPSSTLAASGGSGSVPASRKHSQAPVPVAITSHISDFLGIKLAPCSVPLFQVQPRQLQQYAGGPQVRARIDGNAVALPFPHIPD